MPEQNSRRYELTARGDPCSRRGAVIDPFLSGEGPPCLHFSHVPDPSTLGLIFTALPARSPDYRIPIHLGIDVLIEVRAFMSVVSLSLGSSQFICVSMSTAEILSGPARST